MSTKLVQITKAFVHCDFCTASEVDGPRILRCAVCGRDTCGKCAAEFCHTFQGTTHDKPLCPKCGATAQFGFIDERGNTEVIDRKTRKKISAPFLTESPYTNTLPNAL